MTAVAQSNSGIELSTAVGGSEAITTASENILNNKLDNLLTNNGFVKGINSQFVLQSHLDNIQSQQVGGTSNNLLMYDLSVTTRIINSADQNVFAQTTQTVKGMGDNKVKAINSALNKINYNSESFNTFLQQGKNKILNYYTQNCSRILEEATMLEKTDQYDQALYKLTAIPQAASKCYNTAISKALSIYQKKINFDCKTNLAQAKLAWSANPSWDTANEIQSMLSGVNPQSTCYREVSTFTTTMSNRIKELDGREWKMQYEKEVGLEKDRIQAIKEIGKAYGAGQPKQIIRNTVIK